MRTTSPADNDAFSVPLSTGVVSSVGTPLPKLPWLVPTSSVYETTVAS